MVALANSHAIRLYNHESGHSPKHRFWLPSDAGPPVIQPFHLFMGLLSGPVGVGLTALQSTGIDPSLLIIDLERASPRTPRRRLDAAARLPLGAGATRVVDEAVERAFEFGHDWVGTEHLLLALTRGADVPSAKVLGRHRVQEVEILDWMLENWKRGNAVSKHE